MQRPVRNSRRIRTVRSATVVPTQRRLPVRTPGRVPRGLSRVRCYTTSELKRLVGEEGSADAKELMWSERMLSNCECYEAAQ